jgi:hypothetical protein
MLFQKALASNSVREKNAFLNELKKLMKKHAADYSAAIVEGERLDSAIVEMKATYNQVNEQFQELKNSVCFLTELEFYQAAPDVASHRVMIESLERDISAIGPLPDRDMLASVTANASSQQAQTLYLDLLDFRETRLRQLVDAQKQRIRAAEQRLECVSVVIDQSGSITNLLEKARQHQDEKEKLKVRKLEFVQKVDVSKALAQVCKSPFANRHHHIHARYDALLYVLHIAIRPDSDCSSARESFTERSRAAIRRRKR